MTNQPEKLPVREKQKKLEEFKLQEATIEKILGFNTREAADLLLRFADGNTEALKMLLFLNSKDVQLREMTPDEQSKAQIKLTKGELKQLKAKLREDAKDDRVLSQSIPSHLLEFEDPLATHERLLQVTQANPEYAMISRMIDDIMMAAEKGEEDLDKTVSSYTTALAVNAGLVEMERQQVEVVTSENMELLFKFGVVSEADLEKFKAVPKEKLQDFTAELNSKLARFNLDLSMLSLIPTEMVARLLSSENFFQRAIGTASGVLGKFDNILKLANIHVYKSAFRDLGPEVDKMTLVSVNKMTWAELKQTVFKLQTLSPEHPLIKGQKAEQILRIYELISHKMESEQGGEQSIVALMERVLMQQLEARDLSEEQKVEARKRVQEKLGILSSDILTVDQLLKILYTDPEKRSADIIGGYIPQAYRSSKYITKKAAQFLGFGKEAKAAQGVVQTAQALDKVDDALKPAMELFTKQLNDNAKAMESMAKKITVVEQRGRWLGRWMKRVPALGVVSVPLIEAMQLANGNSKPAESFYNITENVLPWIPGIGQFAGVYLNLKAALTGYNLAGKKLSDSEKNWRYGFAALSAIPFLGAFAKAGKGMKGLLGAEKIIGPQLKLVDRVGRTLKTKGLELAKTGAIGAGAVAGIGGLGYAGMRYEFGESGDKMMMNAVSWSADTVADATEAIISSPRKNDELMDTVDAVIREITGMPLEGEDAVESEESAKEDQQEKVIRDLGKLKNDLESASGIDIKKEATKKVRNKLGMEGE